LIEQSTAVILNTSLSPVGTAVLSEQAGLLAPGSSLPAAFPIFRSVASFADNYSVTVAGPRRRCTDLPF